MLTYIAITGTFNYRTTPTKTPAAGEVIEFVPRTAARPDGSEVLLPKTLSTTLNVSGQIPAGFSLPTLPGGVYYTVRETFEGGRGKYTILVNPGDPTTDLSDVAPVVPPPLLVSTRGPVGPPGPQPPLSNQVPAALGTAAPGTGTKAAREDHIHTMPTAAQVGADTAGAATGAVIAHEAAADPHPQYTTAAEAAAAAPVQTVAGRSGNVTLATADVAGAVDTSDARLSDARTPTAHTHPLSALTQSGATTNQVPQWDGSAWVPATVSGGGGGAWGSITGTLSAQTDLQSALDGKATSAQGAKADSALQPNAPIAGATKTKITYDADGLVTAGADATTADIADSTNRRYVTDAQLTVIGNTSGTNTGDQTNITGNAGTATALQNARTIDGQSFDGTANITVIAPGTHAATSKATPVDADELPLVDSAASNVLKKLTWANLKATLKTYFDALYQAVLVSGTSIKTINGASVLGSGDLTVSGGGSPAGSGTELQYRDGSSFGAMAGTAWDNTNRSLAITGATVTTSNPLFDLSQTWNAGAVTFTGLKLNVTDTASAAASLLFDCQVGGASKITGRKDGKLTIGVGSASDPGLDFGGNGGISAYLGGLYFNTATSTAVAYMIDGCRLKSGGVFGWSSNASFPSSAADTMLNRVAAGIVGVRAASTTAGAALSFVEQTAPAAPATNGVYIYAEDNGSGKTRLMARFATGAAVQIAIEP